MRMCEQDFVKAGTVLEILESFQNLLIRSVRLSDRKEEFSRK